MLGGLAWGAVSQISLQLSRMIVALVLARLLAPHDYGLAAMVLVFSSLVLVFSDLGLGAALVQRRNLTEDDRCTAFWTTLGAGLVFTWLAALSSPLIASFYGEARVGKLCAAFSLIFVIVSLGATQEALLVREMRFRSLELRTMAGTAAGAVAGISVAVAHQGAWAIIIQQLAEATVSAALLWVASPWRPELRYSRSSLRSLWGFSGWLVGNRLLYYLNRNGQNIVVGRFAGAAALGAYTIASNVILAPFSRIAGPIQRVLWPAFAEIQDDTERIAAGWARVTRVLGAIAIPALVGLIIVAPDFVKIFLGPRWHSATPIIQALAWIGILQAVQVVNVDILQARNRTSLVFHYMLFFCVANLAAFSVGLHWGVLGAAIAYAISSTFVEPVLSVLTARELGISPLRIAKALLGVVQATALMAAAVVGVRLLLAGASPAPRLAACVLAGGIVYGAACIWRVPELRAEVRGAMREVRPVPTLAQPEPV